MPCSTLLSGVVQGVRRSARQQTQAHKSADKLETLRDMKASRERQAGYGSDDDAEARLSERQRAALRREIADLESSGEEVAELGDGASDGEDARSGASDEEPEGGDEAPLEDIMAMQVRPRNRHLRFSSIQICAFSLIARACTLA